MVKKTKKTTTNGAFTGTTHVMFILDESGSMESVRDATISGFNEWLGTMQRGGGDIRFTLMKFDTEYRPLEENVPIGDVKELDRVRYEPRGMTALYDAIGHCVKIVEGQVGKKDRALVCVLTDGHENSSREMNRSSTEALIRDLEAKGNWTFTYLSASPSAFDDAAVIGIRAGNTAVFAATPQGTRSAMGGHSHATASYLSQAGPQSASFYVDPDEEKKTGKKVLTPR
jgi:hypothetical protein